MNKTKEKLTDLMLEIIYESKRILTTHSLVEAAYFDLIQENKIKNKQLAEKREQKKKVQRTIHYLKRANYIKIDKNGKVKPVPKGIIRAIFLRSRKIKLKKDSNYYYVVVFDIPEYMRRVRDLFRKILYNFGSDKLQRSVFIVESEDGYRMIKELIKESKISEYVKILKCVKIDKC